MRPTLAACLAAAIASHAAAAAIPDQTFAGTLRCDAMPSHSTIALTQRVTLELKNGAAHMRRPVFIADSAITSGFFEDVTGPVAPDGTLTLRGNGYAQYNSSYTAEYRGTLPLTAPSARFTGVQHWRFPKGPDLDRPCTLDLQRR